MDDRTDIAETAAGEAPARELRIPVRRIGMMLGVARTRRGESRSEVARRTDWRYGAGFLAQVEEGRHVVDVTEIPALAAAYGVDLDDILPDRDGLEVDLRRGRLRAGRASAKIPKRCPVGDLLEHYLAFVRVMRRRPDRSWIPPDSLRLDDIVELALATDTTAAEVERRLVELLERLRPGDDVVWSGGSIEAVPPDQRPDIYW